MPTGGTSCVYAADRGRCLAGAQLGKLLVTGLPLVPRYEDAVKTLAVTLAE